MEISQTGLYHIYNRGNYKQTIFFSPGNYFYFLRKCHKYIKPLSEILAWCLLPNQFHFLIEVTGKSLEPVKVGGINMPAITNSFRLLQSSYAKGINKQLNRTGNLFQQKAKAKFIDKEIDYAAAFHYIHQKPLAAGLVKNAADWPYSSFPDYAGSRNGNLCNRERAGKLLGSLVGLIDISQNNAINEEVIKKIY